MILPRVFRCWRVCLFVLLVGGVLPSRAEAFPVFARTFSVPCSSCHSSITRRSEFGDVFRKNGFQWPGGLELHDSIDLQGRSPLAGALPKNSPIALVAQASASHTFENVPEEDQLPVVSPGGPSFNLLFAAPIGDNVTMFGTWPGSGGPNEMYAAFSRLFQTPALHLKVGLFEQTTTVFRTNENLLAPYRLSTAAHNGHSVGQARMGVEASGVLGRRTFWAAGTVKNSDFGAHWDSYYHLEYKFGGIDLHGREPEVDLDAEPTLWEDSAVTVSHWGYLGKVSDPGGEDTAKIRRLGLDLKLQLTRTSLWSGYQLGLDQELVSNQQVTNVTTFVELSYAVRSWFRPMYLIQFVDSTTMERESISHDVGVIGLVTENLRLRASFRYTQDSVENEVANFQMLFAF